jgi:hypothetical protein
MLPGWAIGWACGQSRSTAAFDATPAPLNFSGVERFAVKGRHVVSTGVVVMSLPVSQVAFIGIIPRDNPNQSPSFSDHRDQDMSTRKIDRITCVFHEFCRLVSARSGRLT